MRLNIERTVFVSLLYYRENTPGEYPAAKIMCRCGAAFYPYAGMISDYYESYFRFTGLYPLPKELPC